MDLHSGLIYAALFPVGIYLFMQSSNSAIQYMLLKSGLKEWMEKMQSGWLNFPAHLAAHAAAGHAAVLPVQIHLPHHRFPCSSPT